MHVCVTLYRTADGHLCGATQGEPGSPVTPFWGTFELIVKDAVQETGEPWLTSQQAGDRLHRSHEHG